MRKHKNLLSFLLIMSLFLTACGGAGSAPAQTDQGAAADAAAEGAGADTSEEAFKPAIPDEPYEAVDYSLYPSPEGGYVGDVMPYVTDEGELELYYLYDTDVNGQGYHPIYKYSTQGLVGFKDHGMVLNYGLMSDPDPALGTGSVMQDPSGLYHLFYTGHNDTGNGGKGKECVMHATSTDRENWVKDEEVLFFAPEGYSKDDFRDPEVFWVDKDQCYWLLIAANENTLGGTDFYKTTCDFPTSSGKRVNRTFYSRDPLAKASRKNGYDFSWLDFSTIPADVGLAEMVNGYIFMGNLGENPMDGLNGIVFRILPYAYRVWQVPSELYDGMIFVTQAHPISVNN